MVSFFDAEFPEQSFEFVDSNVFNDQTSTLLDCFTLKNGSTNKSLSGLFGLSNTCLLKYENHDLKRPIAELDISFSRLSTLNSSVFLMKNGGSFELHFNNERTKEKWLEALQKICVMRNFHERYFKVKPLGLGKSARVSLIQSKQSGKFFAAKSYTKSDFNNSDENLFDLKASFLNKIQLLRATQHPNIIRLYEVYETDNSIYLIMDFVQGISLQELLFKSSFQRDFTDHQIMNTFYSILECAAYMASQGIMHRDLKPSNIIIEKDGKVKLTDFNLATKIDVSSYILKRCGSPGYIAPEIFEYRPGKPNTSYDDRCDVFSAGAILFYMLFGRPLYESKTSSEIAGLNKSLEYLDSRISKIKRHLFNKESRMNKKALDLLLLLLEPNHQVRITAIEALQHPYFASIKSKTLVPKDVFASSRIITQSRSEPKARPSIIVVKNNENIVIRISDSHFSPNQDSSAKTNSMYLNSSKSISPQEINSNTSKSGQSQVSPFFSNSSGSALSVTHSSPLENMAFENQRKANKNLNLLSNIVMIKTSIVKNKGLENKDNGNSTATFASADEFCIQKKTRSDFTRTKTAEFFNGNTASSGTLTAEESEVSDDIDDQENKLEFYIENIKNQEILKPDARMSRYY